VKKHHGVSPNIDAVVDRSAAAAPSSGEESVIAAQLEAHRPALTGHCYRMLGSAVDAHDAVQETMLRALRSLDRFEGRASLRTWLYRIATNVCLDAIHDYPRRVRPMDEGRAGSADDDPFEQQPGTHWLEPIPDASVLPDDANPFELAALRQSVRLAFVSALQHLPPRQRAALLLTEVLGCSAAEVAEYLKTSVAGVKSAVQRARATLASRDVVSSCEPLSMAQSALLDRFIDAFHRYDVDALVDLLCADATLTMPPYALWLRGPETIGPWLRRQEAHCSGSRLVRTAACGSPAFGQYVPNGPNGSLQPWALFVLELSGDWIAIWNAFLDTKTLFPLFDLPLHLSA
jgi:RNA polymerase sigma-70 factor, ECF subfamily